jgi:hypothetical protein
MFRAPNKTRRKILEKEIVVMQAGELVGINSFVSQLPASDNWLYVDPEYLSEVYANRRPKAFPA